MDINKAFPSKYLKAADVDDDMVVTITKVESANVAKQGEKAETKPVVFFHEFDKGMVLNRTNSKMISKIAGSDETDDWTGVKVRLIATEVEFQGDLVMALRIREIKKKSAPVKRIEHEDRVEAPDDSDIPFMALLPLILPAALTLLSLVRA